MVVAISSARADDKDREATTKLALAFAKQHHPELADLLEQLRKIAPKEFAAAISDLDKSRQRIERNKEKSERYDLELEEWKVNSRIRLLVARLAMGQDSTIEADLRTALEQRVRLRLELLEEERGRLGQRIEKLDEQIAQQKSRSTEQIDKELATLLRSAADSGKRPENTKSKTTSNAKVTPQKSTSNPAESRKSSQDRKTTPSAKLSKSLPASSNKKQ